MGLACHGQGLKHEACEELWGLDLFLQEEGRWRGQPEAALKEMVMEHKGKLALGRGQGGGSPSLEMGKTGPVGPSLFLGSA